MKLYTFLIVFVFIIGCEAFEQNNKYTSKYDIHFRKYSKRYFGISFDWRWFKAQAIAESALNDEAKSWTNAKGLMQLLPSTFKELCERHPEIRCDIYHPRWNIAAGIRYDRDMWIKWRDITPFENHLKFTFASYNAGPGKIMEAQKCCLAKGLDKNRWSSVVKVAHEVGGWRYRETFAYIKRIEEVCSEISPFH